MRENIDISKYEAMRKQFTTVKYLISNSKVGSRTVRVVCYLPLKEFLGAENRDRDSLMTKE